MLMYLTCDLTLEKKSPHNAVDIWHATVNLRKLCSYTCFYREIYTNKNINKDLNLEELTANNLGYWPSKGQNSEITQIDVSWYISSSCFRSCKKYNRLYDTKCLVFSFTRNLTSLYQNITYNVYLIFMLKWSS